MKRISKYNSSRVDLIEYIIERKEQAGIIRDFSDAEIKDWGKAHSWDFLWGLCGSLWKDESDSLGLVI